MKTKYGPYSPSRLDTAVCPLRFAREYILKDAPKSHSHEARRGNVVHEVFEDITTGWINDDPMEWKEIEALIANKVAKYKVSREEDILLAVTAARTYLTNPPKGLEHVLGTEELLAVKWSDELNDFEECEWDDPECIFRGKIDILMIEGTVATAIDHKTQPKVEKSNTFQLGFYAWLITKFYPYVTEVNTILHFCRPEINKYSEPTTWTLEDLKLQESVMKVRVGAIEQIDPAEANPNPNFYCNYCSINMECPKIDDLNQLRTKYGSVKASPIMSAQEAINDAGVLTVADEGRKIINSRLQAYCKNIGPVLVHNKLFSYKVDKKWEVDPAKVRQLWEFLEMSGLDPFNFIKFDSKVLGKCFYSKPPSFVEKIKTYMYEKVTTTFGGRKV